MGSCVSNNNKVQIIEADVINGEIKPTNPCEDIDGKYIWINMRIMDKYLVFTQNQGYQIVSNTQIKPHEYVWLRKERINN